MELGPWKWPAKFCGVSLVVVAMSSLMHVFGAVLKVSVAVGGLSWARGLGAGRGIAGASIVARVAVGPSM